jgi:hypothetical protein
MRFKPSDAQGVLNLLSGSDVSQENKPGDEEKKLDAFAILALPQHLRKTALAIHKLGKATPEMTSKFTGRTVVNEEANLLEMVEMGYLKRIKQGRMIYFYIIT